MNDNFFNFFLLENNINRIIKLLKTRRDTKLKSKLYVFCICLFFSSLTWLIIKLSKEYTGLTSFPITYCNFPSDKILVNNIDTNITFRITTKGFKLITYWYIIKPDTIKIDLSKLSKKTFKSHNKAFLLKYQLIEDVSKQLNLSDNKVAYDQDTLFLNFEKIENKKIPVKSNIFIDFDKQYGLLNDIIIEPDSVIISGLPNIVQKYEFAETKKVKLKNITKTQERVVKIPNEGRNSKFFFTPDSVKITIPVGKFTEANFQIPININNKSNNITIRTFPDKVQLACMVALEDYKKINVDLFEAEVSTEKVSVTSNNKLLVKITKYPSFVRITRVDPDFVEYIIIK